ncbi:MAG: carbohydrate ABC transporter permease [Candidatus Zophobacter franzmannii]|nr:carbohydrate ABC transporter permease [Candidatus Zophobacter franzmannii]
MENKIKKLIIYTILAICGLMMVVPFLWMLTTSLKSQTEVNKGNVGFFSLDHYTEYSSPDGKKYAAKIVHENGEETVVTIFDKSGDIILHEPQPITIQLDEDGIKKDFTFTSGEYLKVDSSRIKTVKKFRLHWENYVNAYKKVPFGRYFLNTIFIALTTLVGIITTSALAAYAFARMKFVGKDFLFYLFISMMMVPQPIYLIPSYLILNYIGWIDTYYALIVPWMANIFTIFLFRQHFKTLPQDLFDAASIDGCSRFGMLWQIILPLSKPVIATASIFSIIGSWNSFMWPLVMTNSPQLRVLQVGLSYFSQEAASQTSLLMAASTFSVLPLLILFLIAQKNIIASYSSSGMKE